MNDEPDDFWQRVGAELQAEGAVVPADHEATERVLGRLLVRLPAKPRRSSKRFVFLLVAAALLVASVAAATVVVAHQRRESARASEAMRAAASIPADGPPSAGIASSASLEPSPAPPPSESPALPSARPVALAPASARPNSPENGASPAPHSAAELLSAAGQARRKGRPGHAITLLSDLQARFPNSPEARAGDIALGMLQLQSGEATAARSHFERYLQRSPQGALAADALWGRAQALFAEGNATEARAGLTTLLERYPSSAYASAARAKLRAP